MPTLFYYPTINPPRAVIQQALLYWDGVSSIAPAELPALIGPELRALSDAGLFTAVDMSARLGTDHDFGDAVLGEVGRGLEAQPVDALDVPAGVSAEMTVIFNRKVSYPVTERLLERGYAHRVEGDRFSRYAALRVAPRMQTLVVGAMARLHAAEQNDDVGCTTETALRPYTDRQHSFAALYRPTPHGYRRPCWWVDLGALLPVPAGDILLADLIRFHHRYRDERQRFMAAIENLLHALGQRFDHPRDVEEMFRRDLTAAAADYAAARKRLRGGWVKKPLAVLAALAGGVAADAAGAPAGLSASLTVASGLAVNIATTESRPIARGVDEFGYLYRVAPGWAPGR